MMSSDLCTGFMRRSCWFYALSCLESLFSQKIVNIFSMMVTHSSYRHIIYSNKAATFGAYFRYL